MPHSNNHTDSTNFATEFKGLISQLREGVHPKDSQELLDRLVPLALQYIRKCPDIFDSAPPLPEIICLDKIMTILEANPIWGDNDKPGSVFHEHYVVASCEIEDHRMRDLLANLILFSLENDTSYGKVDYGQQASISRPKTESKNRSSCSTTLKSNGISLNGNKNGVSVKPSSYDSTQNGVGLGSVPLPNYVVEIAKQNNTNIDYNVVQNAIYSFLGVQGKYLKKDVITGRFKLDPLSMQSISSVQAGMLLRLSELGYYHDRITKFSNTTTGYNAMGSMGQALMAKLKLELSEFHGHVAALQDQLNSYRETQMRDYVDRDKSWLDRQPEQLTLFKLLCWYMEPLRRMQWLTKIADACQMKKGGDLASVIYTFLNNGDPMVNKLATDLLTVCCAPLVRMISKWMLEGGIEDSHGEFFIESIDEVGADRLWHDKFRLRHSMLPKFVTLELADKILKTGKSINFLREICKVEEAVKDRKELKFVIDNHVSHIFSYVPDTTWHAAIETCYSQTSKHVLDIMVGPHKLLDHLQGMRRYLLLGQGDFVSIFIENMKDELEKIGTEIYSHDLSAMLDAALRCTNAQYDDPDILNHLDVVVKTPYPGDCGWDVISLQYTVRGPLATMLEPAMPTYKALFKPLWRIKHMEFVLSTKIWKIQMGNAKALRSLHDEISKATYRLHLFTSEIMHFVHQMQYYVLFEVIECNWVELQKRMQQAKALDDILDAHSKFLQAISVGCFVNTSTNMESHLEVVYENIISLENWQENFYKECFAELEAREKMQRAIAESEGTGRFGVTTEQKMERDQERKIFEQKILTCCRTLEGFAGSYAKAVGGFLLALNSSDDHNLQLFGTRLDFNEYYKKRDTNLSKPLTFEHWRMSNVYGYSKSHMGGRYSMYPQPTPQFGRQGNVSLTWD
ncbi:gamma-tubulin complex component 3 [Drosophila navojoa]|nr:gamma-tubulin complex component 3 [Drosophila navojoa]